MTKKIKAANWIQSLKRLSIGIILIFTLLLISQKYSYRWDLTAEKRFTLTKASYHLLKNLKQETLISVYLEGDDLPAGIKNIRNHTQYLLQDMQKASNGKLTFNFININSIKNAGEKESLQKNLIQKGVLPVNLEVNSESGYSEKLIYPGAIITSGNKSLGFTILENQTIFGTQEALENSLNFLEYKIVNTISKLQQEHVPTIAYLQGHGEVSPIQVSSFNESLSKQNFQIKKVEIGIDPLLDGKTDVLIVAKPTKRFSEEDKFIIDQYVMRGGKILWLLDQIIADIDSFQLVPSIFSIPRENNLDDLLFKYGARINDNLVLDLYCAPIPIVEQIAGNPVPKLYPWVFYPIVRGEQKHPIVKNLDPVLLKFPSSIDTIRSEDIKKTILLSSSNYSKTQKTPFQISLEGAKQKPQPALFNNKDIPMAILLEGKFKSFYARRAEQSQKDLIQKENQAILNAPEQSSKMIIVGDGDVIVNEIDPNGRPLPLGYYRFSRETYANKDFLLNAIEYLIDQDGLIEARNRDISIRLLDKGKIQDQKSLWQFLTVIAPIPILLIMGIILNLRRRKKYTR
ncbi:MAG: gliding motility-associated ABC transporter substrate-binding protein GldG [Chitinophagales bacterium]|nr:gliding motility-associated ABC transporter substrate-binding protein GldG [Chitinophagales bacterium]MCZ2392478.1 gliding motility-associated ABC transporter substrate-binding protein GldG [Chitinophagales bacterium]